MKRRILAMLITLVMSISFCQIIAFAEDETAAVVEETEEDIREEETKEDESKEEPEETESTEEETEGHEHEFSDAYEYDSNSHWYACIIDDCDARLEEEHKLIKIWDEPPTMHFCGEPECSRWDCEICGYSTLVYTGNVYGHEGRGYDSDGDGICNGCNAVLVQKPANESNVVSPKTGDYSRIMLMVSLLMALSFSMMGVVCISKVRKNR